MQELSNKANEKISQSLYVISMEMTRDEINSIMPEERTNMDLIPKFVNDLRIIKIGNNWIYVLVREHISVIYLKLELYQSNKI